MTFFLFRTVTAFALSGAIAATAPFSLVTDTEPTPEDVAPAIEQANLLVRSGATTCGTPSPIWAKTYGKVCGTHADAEEKEAKSAGKDWDADIAKDAEHELATRKIPDSIDPKCLATEGPRVAKFDSLTALDSKKSGLKKDDFFKQLKAIDSAHSDLEDEKGEELCSMFVSTPKRTIEGGVLRQYLIEVPTARKELDDLCAKNGNKTSAIAPVMLQHAFDALWEGKTSLPKAAMDSFGRYGDGDQLKAMAALRPADCAGDANHAACLCLAADKSHAVTRAENASAEKIARGALDDAQKEFAQSISEMQLSPALKEAILKDLKDNPIALAATHVGPSVEAFMDEGTGKVLVSSGLLGLLRQGKGKETMASVLAHELGHRFQWLVSHVPEACDQSSSWNYHPFWCADTKAALSATNGDLERLNKTKSCLGHNVMRSEFTQLLAEGTAKKVIDKNTLNDKRSEYFADLFLKRHLQRIKGKPVDAPRVYGAVRMLCPPPDMKLGEYDTHPDPRFRIAALLDGAVPLEGPAPAGGSPQPCDLNLWGSSL